MLKITYNTSTTRVIRDILLFEEKIISICELFVTALGREKILEILHDDIRIVVGFEEPVKVVQEIFVHIANSFERLHRKICICVDKIQVDNVDVVAVPLPLLLGIRSCHDQQFEALFSFY